MGTVLRDRAFEFHAGYTLTELLGEGGQAAVYRVRNPADPQNRPLAVKLFDPNLDEKQRRLFEGEAARAVRLRHDNILATYNFGVGKLDVNDRDDYPFMLMEYAAGGSYAQKLKELARTGQTLPVAETVSVIGQLAAAITYAFEKERVVHRDIKPANILRRNYTGKPDIAVGDFGIASTLHTMMSTQAPMGSLQYIAPEQCDTKQRPEHRTDTYAAAVTAYQLLTGRLPFEVDTPVNLICAHLQEDPCSFGDLQNVEITPTLLSLENVIRRGLAKRLEDRPTIAEFSVLFQDAYERAAVHRQELGPAVIDCGLLPQGAEQPETQTDMGLGGQSAAIPPKPHHPPTYKKSLRQRWPRRRLATTGLTAAAVLGVPLLGGLVVEQLGASPDGRPRPVPSSSASWATWKPSSPASSPPSSYYSAPPTYSASPQPEPGSSPGSDGGVVFPWVTPR